MTTNMYILIPKHLIIISLLGPDYMSRAGPVSRAALVRAGPVAM